MGSHCTQYGTRLCVKMTRAEKPVHACQPHHDHNDNGQETCDNT